MRKPADSPRREEICLRLCDVGGAAMVLINKPLWWSFRWGGTLPLRAWQRGVFTYM